MSNMSYCRFQNTARDFQDCLQAIDNGCSLSPEEQEAMMRLVDMAYQLVDAAENGGLPSNEEDDDE